MRSSRLKLFGILALLVAFMFTMAACDMFDTGVEDPEEDAHGVNVTVDLSDDLVKAQGDVSVLTLEDNLEIDRIEITLGEETKEFGDQDVDNGDIEFGGEYTVTFSDVEPGEYNVKAELFGDYDDKGAGKLYESEEKNINVSADELVEVDLKVMPLEWESLDVTLNDVSDQEAIVTRIESITLKHPAIEGNEETKDNGWEHEDVVNFDADGLDAIPARWHLILEFDSENIANPDAIEVLLLPTEEKEIELDIDYTKGHVEVTVDVHESPDAPNNVQFDYEKNELKWDYDNTDDFTFTILKSEDETINDGDFYEVVAEDEESGFDMLDQEEEYYYWVRAYDEDGYSSDAVATETKYGEEIVENEEELTAALGYENISTIIVAEGNYDIDEVESDRLEVEYSQTILGPNEGVAGDGEREDEATLEGQVVISADDVVFDGLEVSPPDATEDQKAEAIRVSNTPNNVKVRNNIVTDFGEDGLDEWDGVDGINVFGGVEDDAIENVRIKGNKVENIEGRDTNGGAAGISIQGNVDGAIVEDNIVTNVGLESTAWAFGIVVRGTGNHDEDPVDVEIEDNVVNDILSDSDTDTVGVGIGTEAGSVRSIDGNDVNLTGDYEWHFEDKTEDLDLNDVLENNNFPDEAEVVGNTIQDIEENNAYNLDSGFVDESIQAVIDDADTEEGDTILVGSGEYVVDEIIEVDVEGLTLKSAEEHQAVIKTKDDNNIGGGGVNFNVTADDVTIEDFKINPEASGIHFNAINLNGESGIARNNYVFFTSEKGTPLIGGEGHSVTIEDNVLENGPVAYWGSGDATIKGNDVEGEVSDEALWSTTSGELTVEDNVFTDVEHGEGTVKFTEDDVTVNGETDGEGIADSVFDVNEGVDSVEIDGTAYQK